MIRAFRLHLKRFIMLLSSCISKFCVFFVANFFSRITVTEVSILSYLHLKNLVDRVIVMTDWSKLTWDQRIATCNSKTHEQEPTYNKRKKMRMEKKASCNYLCYTSCRHSIPQMIYQTWLCTLQLRRTLCKIFGSCLCWNIWVWHSGSLATYRTLLFASWHSQQMIRCLCNGDR